RLFAPPGDRFRLVLRLRLLENGRDGGKNLSRRRVGLGVCPADDRVAGRLRQLILELAARLLGGDEDDLRRVQAAPAPVELLRDALQVLLDELLDVPLVPRLRPTTLIMSSGLLVELVDDWLEPSRTQAIELPLLTPHDRDDRPIHARKERHQRREIEVASDADAV